MNNINLKMISDLVLVLIMINSSKKGIRCKIVRKHEKTA